MHSKKNHWANGSSKLKDESTSSNERPLDPLDQAQKAIEDGKKAARLLKDADDWDEPTGRTEVTVNVKMQSQPEIQVDNTNDSDPPLSKAGQLTKNVGVLAKLLPKNQRLMFFIGLMVFGSLLVSLQQGWIRIGPH